MKNPWAWFRDLFARQGLDPMQVTRYVLPYPVAGVTLLPDEILSLATVWACIDAIARGIGQCDWQIYAPGVAGRRELQPDDPLAYLLNTRPNPEMTAIAFREALLFNAIPHGNGYAEIIPDRAGRPVELWPLATERVTPRRDRETWALYYDYYQPSGEVVRLPPERVFHLRGPGLHGLLGDNVIARAAKSMAVAAAQERFTAAFFGQGANPGGVLEFPGKLGEEQYNRLKDDFAEKKKGPENAHKPIILESGMKWTTIGMDPTKSQLVEGRQFQVEEICRWFGVPLHKVQHLLHATFSNIEHQSIEFVRDAISPWCKRIEQEADFKLLHNGRQRGPWKTTRFDTRPLLAGDAKSRADGYAILRQNGIANANEIRHLEGMNPIAGPEGDAYLVQSNLTTLEKLLEPPEPPAPPALPSGAAPADDSEDPGADPADAKGNDLEADPVARQALTVIVSGSLQRYARRLANRRADLERGNSSPSTIEARLGEERTKLWPRLLEDLEAAQPFAALALGRPLVPEDLKSVLEWFESGDQPAAAVAKLLPAACPRPG